MVIKCQQFDVRRVRFHFFLQGGGGGDACHQQYLLVSGEGGEHFPAVRFLGNSGVNIP